MWYPLVKSLLSLTAVSDLNCYVGGSKDGVDSARSGNRCDKQWRHCVRTAGGQGVIDRHLKGRTEHDLTGTSHAVSGHSITRQPRCGLELSVKCPSTR